MLGAALAFALPAWLPGAAAAQEIPSEFSLPTPSPTSTPVPQGPADERAGVRIGPRVITEERAPPPASRPQPAPTATQTAPQTSAPARNTPRAAQTPAPTASRAAQQPERPGPEAGVTNERPAPVAEDATGAETALDEPSGPGFETFDEESGSGSPTGADGRSDVSGLGGETESGVASPAMRGAEASSGFSSGGLSWWLSAALALLAALIGAGGWLVWRRRTPTLPALASPDLDLAPGLRRTFGEGVPAAGEGLASLGHAASAKPKAVPSTSSERIEAAEAAAMREPARIDLSLTITAASRSLMRFTIEFTLEIFNRSDHAVRDLNVSAKLACAQRGAQNSGPVAGGQPTGQIERIGPQQSRKLSGRLQLPIEEITPIDQGGKPVLIPLLHFILESAGGAATSRTFVVGTPSASSKTRVHPLLLEGPPGSFSKLRAQLVRQPDAGTAAAPRSTEPA